jgi:enoyl-CoA hydratase/carnithine racemase
MKRVIISAPGKNALSIDVLEGLRRDVLATGGEPFLLVGDGDTFCAGLNLKELVTLDELGMRKLLTALDAAIETIFHHPAPTVALVHGHAIAGGAVLAMCCDLVVAGSDPRIRIGLNETALGLPLPPKVIALARYRLPPGAVERVVLGGGLHAPSDARALGIVDLVDDDPGALAGQRLDALAAMPRSAYVANKRQLREGALATTDADRVFAEQVLPVWSSAETRDRAHAALSARR